MNIPSTPKRSNLTRTILLCIFILFLGFLPGLVTMNEMQTWFSQLNKPSINPPAFVFGPVWTTLYILMGVSFSAILSKATPEIRRRLVLVFILQLVFNLFWTILFFKFHLIGWALAEIAILWLLILLMIYGFYKVDRKAAMLQIPYLTWVSFATILNYSFFILN